MELCPYCVKALFFEKVPHQSFCRLNSTPAAYEENQWKFAQAPLAELPRILDVWHRPIPNGKILKHKLS